MSCPRCRVRPVAEERIHEVIAKLLALADPSRNPDFGEAGDAYRKACKLMRDNGLRFEDVVRGSASAASSDQKLRRDLETERVLVAYLRDEIADLMEDNRRLTKENAARSIAQAPIPRGFTVPHADLKIAEVADLMEEGSLSGWDASFVADILLKGARKSGLSPKQWAQVERILRDHGVVIEAMEGEAWTERPEMKNPWAPR